MKRCTIDERPQSFDDCIVWARNQYADYFEKKIAQLLHNFPSDHVSPPTQSIPLFIYLSFIPQLTTSGAPFWSGPKRCPQVLPFDTNNTLHVDFVEAASLLHAETYNITG